MTTHRARLETCMSGVNTDRIPFALWRHFPVDDQTPDGLAAATAEFQRLYDFDLIKVTPASSFCIKDWGVKDRWNGNMEGTRDYEQYAINNPEDWARLNVLNPLKGHLGNQIECLNMLVREFSPQTPILQTIFSPLAQAKNLIGKDRLTCHLRKYPEAVHAGLQVITQTTIDFISEAVKTGIDGVFYAVQHAQYGLLSENEFETFGKRYDMQVMAVVKNLWLNLIHLHGENVMFSKVIDYPAAIINWHDRHTPPSLEQAGKLFDGMLCGGLRQWETMVIGNPESVKKEALDAIHSTGGKKFILGTGCVVPIVAPRANLLAVWQTINQ